MIHDALSALRQTLKNAAVAQEFLAANSRTTLDPTRSYVTSYFLGGDTVPRTLGGDTGTNTFAGVAQVDVYLPVTDGDGTVANKTNTLSNLFSPHRSHTYNGTVARCTRVATAPLRVEGGHYVLTVTLYWEATLNR